MPLFQCLIVSLGPGSLPEFPLGISYALLHPDSLKGRALGFPVLCRICTSLIRTLAFLRKCVSPVRPVLSCTSTARRTTYTSNHSHSYTCILQSIHYYIQLDQTRTQYNYSVPLPETSHLTIKERGRDKASVKTRSSSRYKNLKLKKKVEKKRALLRSLPCTSQYIVRELPRLGAS